MSVKLTGLNKEDFTLDNNLNGILGYFHSVWQTPEEQLVNVINMVKSGYRLDKLHSKKNPKFQEAFANFRYPETILMLPTNKYCYYEHTGNTYVTYNDVYFYHKRKVSLFENKGIKKVLKLEKTEPNILPKNSYFNYKKNITDVLEVNDYLNKLAICKNIYQETDFKSINSEIFFRKNYPNLTNNTFWTTNFDKHFKKTTIIIDDYKEAVAQYCNFLKKSDTDEFFTKDIISPQQSWENKKNLFLEPSIVSKKFHYEQSNHPEYDDRIQYRTIDKIDVFDQIKLMIENMSESQKNYENKRAEKHGVTLEDFILKQKYKLAK
jgi:hypothetical protein